MKLNQSFYAIKSDIISKKLKSDMIPCNKITLSMDWKQTFPCTEFRYNLNLKWDKLCNDIWRPVQWRDNQWDQIRHHAMKSCIWNQILHATKSYAGPLSSWNKAVNNQNITCNGIRHPVTSASHQMHAMFARSDLSPNGVLDLVVLQCRGLEALQGRSGNTGNTGLLLLIISHHGELHAWEGEEEEEEEQEEEEDRFSM